MKMPERYMFPAVFGYEPDEEISVSFPDLDVATSGKNERDALLSARALLGITLFGLEQDGEDIPEPSPMSEISTGEREKTVLVDVYMPSIRMANRTRSVSRTVTLPAWLNAKAAECGFNFSQVLQEALISKLNGASSAAEQ